ncbi:unnamed protein product, partial [Ectocarpus sp. 8 AP-2014]
MHGVKGARRLSRQSCPPVLPFPSSVAQDSKTWNRNVPWTYTNERGSLHSCVFRAKILSRGFSHRPRTQRQLNNATTLILHVCTTPLLTRFFEAVIINEMGGACDTSSTRRCRFPPLRHHPAPPPDPPRRNPPL